MQGGIEGKVSPKGGKWKSVLWDNPCNFNFLPGGLVS